jgi:hypothetical protein
MSVLHVDLQSKLDIATSVVATPWLQYLVVILSGTNHIAVKHTLFCLSHIDIRVHGITNSFITTSGTLFSLHFFAWTEKFNGTFS